MGYIIICILIDAFLGAFGIQLGYDEERPKLTGRPDGVLWMRRARPVRSG
jgi:hypothetical protein